MPVSPSTWRTGVLVASLREPQARTLRSLLPADPSDHIVDWPTYNRRTLAERAGFTKISGTLTRALNGIREGSSSGAAHLGLLALGYVEEVPIDIEGRIEICYRATQAGVAAYREHESRGGLRPVKDAASCTNLHQGKGENHRSKRKEVEEKTQDGLDK